MRNALLKICPTCLEKALFKHIQHCISVTNYNGFGLIFQTVSTYTVLHTNGSTQGWNMAHVAGKGGKNYN